MTIDGYTQPGAKQNTIEKGATNAKPLIELSGENIASGASGLQINGPNSVVRGLVVNRFDGAGLGIVLLALASGSRVEGNFIGTDPSGTLDRGNGLAGVSTVNSGLHTIGGTSPSARNLISGNGSDFPDCGVRVRFNEQNVKVAGNLIGTKKDGSSSLGNSEHGVCMESDPIYLLNGSVDVTENTIAFNGGEGVQVYGE